MAITKIHPIQTTLGTALEYIENPLKTDKRLLVTGFGCTPQTAMYEFLDPKELSGKKDGYLAFHLIQSFSPGEVDYETAHKIGLELADKILKGKYQYVCATHIDKGSVHNHIIFNSVSFKDFKKYNSSEKSYYNIRRQSDILCRQFGLSIIQDPKEKGKSHYEHSLDKKGQSWKSLLRQNIDRAIQNAESWDEFLWLMEQQKYDIKRGKFISFRADGQERFTRAKTLGENYTEENIRSRILNKEQDLLGKKPTASKNQIIDIENNAKSQQSKGFEIWARKYNLSLAADTLNYLAEHNLSSLDELDEHIEKLSEKSSSVRTQVKEIERKVKLLDEQIHEIDVYRKTKPIVEGTPKHFGIDKYKKEHEADFILFNAAEKACIKFFGKGGKLPLIKDLRAEQRALKAEMQKLKQSVGSENEELSELKNIRRNIEKFLGNNKKQTRQAQKKRKGELE